MTRSEVIVLVGLLMLLLGIIWAQARVLILEGVRGCNSAQVDFRLRTDAGLAKAFYLYSEGPYRCILHPWFSEILEALPDIDNSEFIDTNDLNNCIEMDSKKRRDMGAGMAAIEWHCFMLYPDKQEGMET